MPPSTLEEKITQFEIAAREKLDKLEKKANSVDEKINKYSSQKIDTATRSEIATKFINWYFWCLAGSFIGLLVYNGVLIFNNKQDYLVDILDIITLVGSIVGTPLGFVVGYYFKDTISKSNIDWHK